MVRSQMPPLEFLKRKYTRPDPAKGTIADDESADWDSESDTDYQVDGSASGSDYDSVDDSDNYD
jgi:hypothetical protein